MNNNSRIAVSEKVEKANKKLASFGIKKMYLYLLIVLELVILIGNSSYALFTLMIEKKGVISMEGANISVSETIKDPYDEGVELKKGESGSLILSMKNNSNFPIDYRLVVYSKDNRVLNFTATSINYSGSILANKTRMVEVLITNNSETTATFLARGEYKIAGGNYPNLANGDMVVGELIYRESHPVKSSNMIAVYYNGDNWAVADDNNVNENFKWYNYNEFMWANAVTVKDVSTTSKSLSDGTLCTGWEGFCSRADYLNASYGVVIPEDDINTMWVWIPKYEYQIKNDYGRSLSEKTENLSLANPDAIDINFLPKNITIPNAGYEIPQAFWWDNNSNNEMEPNELKSGLWIAKFETSKDITIKPNIVILNNNTIGDFFWNIRSMELKDNIYGFPQESDKLLNTGEIENDSNNFDIHLIKNIEWDVISYLSQSIYGKYGNNNYLGNAKEIYNNNYLYSSNSLTGCSSGIPVSKASDNCVYKYNISFEGTGASTTGTIYGIYDTSGGLSEITMGNYSLTNSITLKNDNNFINYSTLANKYYNLYNTQTINSKTIGWYNDEMTFGNENSPWITRGGNSNNLDESVGIFAISNATGEKDYFTSSRIAITF